MKKSAYKELSELEKTYWWHVGRMVIIDKQLKPISNKSKKLLNVGSGTGGTLPVLEKHYNVTNADMSPDAISYLQNQGYSAVLFDGKQLPFADSSFDAVAALDVLEHTPNDIEALEEWLRVLKPGGELILTVPAYQWLWSTHDEDNLHYRRYSRRSLKKVIVSHAHVKVSKLSYMIVFSLPLITGFRLLGKISGLVTHRKKHPSNFVAVPRPINNLFISLLSFEGTMLRSINFPAGTSLIAILKKRSS